jgi:hypothetical protein
MNVIGGTQGAQVETVSDLANLADISATIVQNGSATVTTAQGNALTAMLTLPNLNLWSGDASLNFQDNLLSDSDVPLQFRTKAADCRMFYTADDINNIAKTWSKISGGNFTCVDGGSKPGQAKKNSAPRSVSGGLGWAAAIAIGSAILMF